MFAPIDRAVLEFPLEISPTSLYICDKLSSSVRTFTSREKKRVQLASFNLRAYNYGGGFRSVRYSALLHTRLSSLVPRMFPFPCIIAIPYPYWLFSGYPRARVYPGRRENRGIESRGLEERMISLAGFVTRNWILREIRQTFRFQYLTRYFFPFDSLLNRPFVN